MKDSWFIDNFLKIAAVSYPESYFIDNLTFTYGSGDDYDGPLTFTADMVEIDCAGRAHLWLFASLYSPEAMTGALIGRAFACSQVLAMADKAALRGRVERAARRRRYDVSTSHFAHTMERLRRRFETWNLVVCGGKGCELAGRDDNLLHRLYAPLSETVGRDVNTWQFYQTSTGFDLRSLWDVAWPGRLSLSDRLAAYDGRGIPMPAPADDFDIGAKRDLHLKRRKGFHLEGHDAYFADRGQILAR